MDQFNNILYINLLHRTDRKIHVEQQLEQVGWKGQRFNAIKMDNGAIGCSISHLKCLQMAKDKNWDNVVIVEDDITFLDPPLIKSKIENFLKITKKWDVLLLAGNNVSPYQEIDHTCIKVSHCQTTTGYIVQKHYYDELINNIKTGLNYLLREPDKGFYYAIDKFWLKLQRKDNWFLIIPLSVIQKPGYSDIENRDTDYSKLLTSVNKRPMFKQPTLPYL